MTETSDVTRLEHGRLIPVPGRWRIDSGHTHVGFGVRHLLTLVRGRFAEFEGEIIIADESVHSSAEITVDVSSLDVGNAKAAETALGEMLLDVETHPTMRFTSTGVEPAEDDSWLLHGELTLAGTVRPISLHTRFHGAVRHPYTKGAKMSFSATGRLRRSDFGVDASFPVESSPGVFILGDRIDLILEIEADLLDA